MFFMMFTKWPHLLEKASGVRYETRLWCPLQEHTNWLTTSIASGLVNPCCILLYLWRFFTPSGHLSRKTISPHTAWHASSRTHLCNMSAAPLTSRPQERRPWIQCDDWGLSGSMRRGQCLFMCGARRHREVGFSHPWRLGESVCSGRILQMRLPKSVSSPFLSSMKFVSPTGFTWLHWAARCFSTGGAGQPLFNGKIRHPCWLHTSPCPSKVLSWAATNSCFFWHSDHSDIQQIKWQSLKASETH